MTLFNTISKSGKFPQVQIQIYPIDGNRKMFSFPQYDSNGSFASGFTNYEFDSNMMIPVDSFSFEFASPGSTPVYELIKEGDHIHLICNGIKFASGIVDTVEIRTDPDSGEMCVIRGRDMLSQLEDQSALNDKDSPIWANAIPITQAVQTLIQNTRIAGLKTSGIVPGGAYQFPTEPGESKMSALIRFLEPFNLLVWADPDAKIVIGKPNFKKPSEADKPKRTLVSSQSRKYSNVMNWRVSYNGSVVPNRYLPIFSAQENVTVQVSKQQIMKNSAKRPTELRNTTHRITKTVVVSIPGSFDATFVNNLKQAGLISNNDSGQSNLLQYFARKQIARDNVDVLKVDVEVPGHFDLDGMPYKSDTVWYVDIERASLRQWMYCYAVKYKLDPVQGQITLMSLTNLNTIVADTVVK